jgi:hypothetical protein
MLAAHEMFAFMSPALAREIVEYLHLQERDAYRSTLNAVADLRRVRPVFFERKPRAEQHLAIIESLSRPKLELNAIAALQTWLMKSQSALLADFLNALEIKHENGAVDDLPPTMDDAKLTAAIEGILAKHPAERVALYLRAFNDLSKANWENLGKLLETDPRLQLGG